MSENETPEIEGPEKHTVVFEGEQEKGDGSEDNDPKADSNEGPLEELRVEDTTDSDDPNLVTEDMVNRVGGSDSTDTSEAHRIRQEELQAARDEHDRSQLVHLDQMEDAEEAARERREALGYPSDRPEGEFTGANPLPSENDK